MMVLFGGGLGGVAWLEEIHQWAWTWRIKSLVYNSSLCFLLMFEAMSSQLHLPVAMPTARRHARHPLPCFLTTTDSKPSGTVHPNQLFLPEVAFCDGVFSQQQKTNPGF